MGLEDLPSPPGRSTAFAKNANVSRESVTPSWHHLRMEVQLLSEAADLVDRANQLVEKAGRLRTAERSTGAIRRVVAAYGRLVKLGSAGGATAARILGDPGTLAGATGTSITKAKEALKTAEAADQTPELGEAFRSGELSLDQATEIAKTEKVAPGSAGPLLERVRGGAPIKVLRDEGRRRRLEAQFSEGLAKRQREARYLWHGITDQGMYRLEAELEPEVGARLVNRLEAQARRLSKAARHAEPFPRYLADALPDLVTGKGTGKGKTELVVLVSQGVAQRGWQDVQDGEFCKIPGVGPIDPDTARRIADDAFLSGIFFDGEDLRQIKRWTRHIPAAVKAALNLGDPPGFDGPRCEDCGMRHGLEWDHDDPRANGGETSVETSNPVTGDVIRRRRRVIARREGSGRRAPVRAEGGQPSAESQPGGRRPLGSFDTTR